jgi:hypothetical protein
MRRDTADAVLARIRQLLAKAESTTFEAEALAFTAKAHELMTRHAIDLAVLDATASSPHDGPITVTIPIDAPYALQKALLLQFVAEAGRCRSAFSEHTRTCPVVGFADDIAAVELLFTSLLVQAQTALDAAARRAPAGANARSRSFRSAFLHGFSGRIAERLAESNAAVYASVVAERGDAFLPALRSRGEEVDDVFTSSFLIRDRRSRGGFDPAGWTSGRQAADTAQLNGGTVERRSA